VLDAVAGVPIPDAPANHNGNHPSPGGRHFLHPEMLRRNARIGLDIAAHPREALERARAAIDLVVKDDLISAPHTSFNTELTAARHYRTAHISIADIKQVRQRHGGTLNDVVLAVCASGLRELLLSRGEQPPPGMRAQVPVNIRSKDHEHAMGNEVTSMFVELPVEEPDPLTRLARVIERCAELKAGTQQVGGKTLLDLADMGPPVIGGLVARSTFGSSRMFNLTITNVPGPQMELTAFGAQMVDALPFVPLFAEHTIGIAIFSYNGDLTFGICADRHNAPDIDVLATGIELSFDQLRAGVPA
jgi:WS/DGAT/MGAT family acyltransferase